LFDQILDLVGQPPGSLVYHFIILFAAEAALAISFGQWMRERDQGTGRLTVAIVVILLARTLILIASLLAWRGYLPRNVLLPPVERAVDTITILGLAWAFITMDDPALLRRNFLPDMLAAFMLGIAGIGFIGSYYYWSTAAASGELFNGLWLDKAWSIAQIGLTVVALIWMLARIRYIYDPFLKSIMLIILGGAAGLHLVNPVLGDVAAAMRVGQIMVMPMLAAVAYRHVVEQLLHWDEFEPSRPAEAAPVPTITVSQPQPTEAVSPPPESLAETVPLQAPVAKAEEEAPSRLDVLEVVEAIGGLLSTLDEGQVVREAARAVAVALRADICVIAIVDEDTQQAGIVGGYDNISQVYLKQAVLELSDHPTIVNALGRLRQMRLTAQRNSRELRDLYERLSITHVGPAYLQPLVNEDERIGVLVVGTPYSGRALDNDERNLLDRLGPLVTAALLNAESYGQLAERSEDATSEAAAKVAALTDDLTAKVAELNQAQRQISEMKAYIRDIHRQLEELPKQQESLREQNEVLTAEIERLRREAVLAEQLRDENELLKQTLQQKEANLQIIEKELEQLRQKTSSNALFANQADSYFLQRQLEEARTAAQTEIASLRARLAQASISQQEVAFLQEQLALKAREAISLQARLTETQAVVEALREQINNRTGNPRELEALQARVAAQAAELAVLKAELAEAQASANLAPEAVHATQAMEQIDRNAMIQLEAQLAERAALIEALEAQLAEKTRAIVELKSHMAEVDTSLRNMEKQLSYKTEEVAALQASLAEAHAQAQQRIKALEAEVPSTKREVTEVDRARIEALEAQLAEKAAAIQLLERQLQETSQSMAMLEQQLSATNQAVDAAISEARQIDSSDEVIASIAQELRTPMSSIMGYTELLLRESVGILGSLQRKFLQRVKANTERMGALLDDLIRITALDTGRLQLEPEKVEVIYAVEEVIMTVANQYREKGLTLRLALPEELPPITADRDAFSQVIGHLLSNAALASPVGGEVQLLVDAREDRLPAPDGEKETACLYIEVEDSGTGVAVEDYDRVFMRKYRADNPLIEGLGDTGVSLSLAKALVDAHGGRIWLTSQKDVGTTFHVLLPLEPNRQGGTS
jgi:signal transduction histidine kinase